MPQTLPRDVDELPPRNHSRQMQELSDEAAEILRRHGNGEIDGDEAARLLLELKLRHRTFLDRLIG